MFSLVYSRKKLSKKSLPDNFIHNKNPDKLVEWFSRDTPTFTWQLIFYRHV